MTQTLKEVLDDGDLQDRDHIGTVIIPCSHTRRSGILGIPSAASPKPQTLPQPGTDEFDNAPITSTDIPDENDEITPAEYHEWPFQGTAKYITVGNKTVFNLEFSIPCGLGDASLAMNEVDLESTTSVPGHLVAYQREARSKVSSLGLESPGNKWAPEEDYILKVPKISIKLI
ncbi:hypothetical protein B0T10DRAFT_465030 [Thelonectria olida]|uniref:Uncharacterized protein n=1 Tax=Thelonectria olida TaxID=1576542 RepID=A0A9P8VT88_9HYPO|nr:hypothetical protein B0T10DRAFT_465030 [Thelonectria olida]